MTGDGSLVVLLEHKEDNTKAKDVILKGTAVLVVLRVCVQHRGGRLGAMLWWLGYLGGTRLVLRRVDGAVLAPWFEGSAIILWYRCQSC